MLPSPAADAALIASESKHRRGFALGSFQVVTAPASADFSQAAVKTKIDGTGRGHFLPAETCASRPGLIFTMKRV